MNVFNSDDPQCIKMLLDLGLNVVDIFIIAERHNAENIIKRLFEEFNLSSCMEKVDKYSMYYKIHSFDISLIDIFYNDYIEHFELNDKSHGHDMVLKILKTPETKSDIVSKLSRKFNLYNNDNLFHIIFNIWEYTGHIFYQSYVFKYIFDKMMSHHNYIDSPNGYYISSVS